MSQAKRVAKNTGFLYARMAITVFISLYATRLVLGALGATDFGIFNVVAGAITMLTFLNAAMTSATQRFMSYAEGKGDFDSQKSIFNVSIVLHLLIGVIVVLLLEVGAYYFFNGVLEIPQDRMFAAKVVYQSMVISTFFKIISVPYDAVINAHENMLLVAILGVVEALLKLGIALYLTVTHFDGLITYGVLMGLLAVILLVIRRIYCHKKYAEVIIKLRRYYNKAIFKEMGSFAGWSFLGSSTGMVAFYGQGIILNMFFGPIVNAAQGVANQVSGQLGAFSLTMLSALNPVIDKNAGAGNNRNMLQASITGAKLSFFLFAFLAIPVILEMAFVLKIWLKNVPQYAIIFCSLLLVKNITEQLTLPLTSAIRANGKIKAYQITTSILNIFPILLSYLLFSMNFEPQFLYWSFLIWAILNGMVVIFFAHRVCNLNVIDYLKNVIFRSLLFFGITLFLAYLPHFYLTEGVLRLSLTTVITVIVGISSLYFIVLGKKEQATLTSILFKKLKN